MQNLTTFAFVSGAIFAAYAIGMAILPGAALSRTPPTAGTVALRPKPNAAGPFISVKAARIVTRNRSARSRKIACGGGLPFPAISPTRRPNSWARNGRAPTSRTSARDKRIFGMKSISISRARSSRNPSCRHTDGSSSRKRRRKPATSSCRFRRPSHRREKRSSRRRTYSRLSHTCISSNKRRSKRLRK